MTTVDLADPALCASGDRFDRWRETRATHPVAWVESVRSGGFWSVTGHRFGTHVLDRDDVFTSTGGMRLDGTPASVRAASGRMLVVSDGAAHRRLRAAHAPWFQGRALAHARERLDARLATHVPELTGGGPVELVGALAERLPTWVVCEMLGVPAEDWDGLARHAAAAFGEGPGRKAAGAQIFAYFGELLDFRRRHPGDDLVSALLESGELTEEEILLNCDGLVNGGLGTTRHGISGAVLAFARHPGEWDRLRERPRLISSAIEEVLRWASPPMHVMRTATADVRLGGAAIVAGERVVVWIPACNRDGSVFAAPDAFVIDRRPNPHLSLGGGPHYCIGAALARLELRCLLQALLPRVRRFELTGAAVRARSNFLHGLERLEVRLVSG